MLKIAKPRTAVFLFHRNAVQTQRAEFWPEVSWKLVAFVDLIGTRRDFMHGKIAHGFADRIRDLPEIEIKHTLGVGNHISPIFRKASPATLPRTRRQEKA